MKKILFRILKEIYHQLPLSIYQRIKIKRLIIQHFPKLMGRLIMGNYSGASIVNSKWLNGLVDLSSIESARNANGNIAIHIHIFYEDLIGELTSYLKNMPFVYDLFVSVVSKEGYDQTKESFRELPNVNNLVIEMVPNRGRDIAPFFCTFGEKLKQYEYVGHFHTKKSLYNQGATAGWRGYLLDSLLGSEGQIKKIFKLFQDKVPYGLVYPQTYFLLPYQAHTWLANKEQAEFWSSRLGFTDIPRGYFDFPVGSMFWARAKAIMPLLNANISIEDFPKELGQSDGTLAHTLERLIAVSSVISGMKLGILADPKVISWSPWRLDQYTNRSYADLKWIITNPKIKVIGFDLFDTLFCRPLLDPESTKKIIARRTDERTGNLYRDFRAIAEDQARITKGSDVSLGEVFTQLAKISGITKENIRKLKNLEEEIEISCLELRYEIMRLYQDAISTGKLIILVSDTNLPKELLTRVLHDFDINGWDDLFVSNESGLRKDSGLLYQFIHKKYNIQPNEFLMIGDNERSDYQIPVDMGSTAIHQMRPVELARGLPRFSHLINNAERNNNLDEEILLGLVVRNNFSPICLNNFDPASLVDVDPFNIGYSIVGPLLVSFSNWLVKTAQNDGVKRLYFLSREGKIMKSVYDKWIKGITGAPISEYLVLSRRATSVPAIESFSDIENIAKTTFYPNKVEKFLLTRFGLNFSKEKWIDISKETGIEQEAEIEIQNGNIGQVYRLLKYLESDIRDKAANERVSILKYLESKGMNIENFQAVVDIGYSGSVQGYLNTLLLKKVSGYYLMTDARSKNIVTKYQVFVKGCFEENIVPAIYMPPLFKNSFLLEKLLSSKDEQIEYYEVNPQGKLSEKYRALSENEKKSNKIRDGIEEGCLKFADDVSQIRNLLLPDFDPPLSISQIIMEEFLSNPSQMEIKFLTEIVLDDYYCGRDLVA